MSFVTTQIPMKVPHPAGPIWYVDGETIYIPIDSLPEASQEFILGGVEMLARIGHLLRPYLEAGYAFETIFDFEKVYMQDLARRQAEQAQPKAEKPRRKKHSDYAKTFLKIGRRDGFHCQHCQKTVDLEIDHIIPVIKGGTNDLPNLQLLCQACNSKKGIL